MKIAVVGCLHGELDIIYKRIDQMEKRENIVIDLLLVCGDFQAIRNVNDFKCIAMPEKYKRLGTFYQYYFGHKRASKLTILIGGNHEASNYMQTLPYGGWVAPNMYYLGWCSVVRFGGLRIGGISGIFKSNHAKLGHFESLPYNEDTKRSVYHMRETEVYKLLQLTGKQRSKGPVTPTPERKSGLLDIFISHDWPLNIHQCGNVGYLLKKKPEFRGEVKSGKLGNILLEPLVNHIRPRHWFAAHLHVGFRATVIHPQDESGDEATSTEPPCTQFQALDKVLDHRHYLKVVDVEPQEQTAGGAHHHRLQYDPEWLAILKKTDHLLKIDHQSVNGIDIFHDQNSVRISDKDIEEIYTLFNNDLTIPDNFSPCEPVPAENIDNDPDRVINYVNPQTTKLCQLLSIEDPNQLAIYASGSQVDQSTEWDKLVAEKGEPPSKKAKLEEPEDETPLFIIDTVGTRRHG